MDSESIPIDNYRLRYRFASSYNLCVRQRTIEVLENDEKAADIYKYLKSRKIRIDSMDLKTSLIAIFRKAILVSRNLKDYE